MRQADDGPSPTSSHLMEKDAKHEDQAEEKVGDRAKHARLDLMSGLKLWVTVMCLTLGLLLSTLETSIIATALVSISSSLGSYHLANWVVTAYLITYTSFLMVFARLSDLFGRKGTFLFSLGIFTTFSLACGLAQSMIQLIIFRALQGLGGAGLYTLAMSVLTEVVPMRHIGIVAGLMASVFATSSLLGPILGGVIVTHTTWRWVFYLNVPVGGICFLLTILLFPSNADPLPVSWRTFRRLDLVGVVTSLAGTILLIFALESGGSYYPWNGPAIIATFTIAGVCFILFIAWETFLCRQKTSMLPLFPIHLVTHRVIGFTLLAGLLTGGPFMMTIIFLPQRLQLQNGLSPQQAGIDMLPLLLLSATAAAVSGIANAKKNISWYLLVASLALQLVGLGLMSTLPISAGHVASAQYGYQVILGFGFGMSLSCLAVIVRVEVANEDISIIMGAITQVRVLGGLIGIAIGEVIVSSYLSSALSGALSKDQLHVLQDSAEQVKALPGPAADLVKTTWGRASRLQNHVMLGFTGAALLASFGAWRRHFINPAAIDKARREALKNEET